MGMALLGGMTLATFLGVFLYPMLFVFIGKIAGYEKKRDLAKKMAVVKRSQAVTPAKAGVQNPLKELDPRLRGDDERITSATLYDAIKETAKIKQ